MGNFSFTAGEKKIVVYVTVYFAVPVPLAAAGYYEKKILGKISIRFFLCFPYFF